MSQTPPQLSQAVGAINFAGFYSLPFTHFGNQGAIIHFRPVLRTCDSDGMIFGHPTALMALEVYCTANHLLQQPSQLTLPWALCVGDDQRWSARQSDAADHPNPNTCVSAICARRYFHISQYGCRSKPLTSSSLLERLPYGGTVPHKVRF